MTVVAAIDTNDSSEVLEEARRLADAFDDDLQVVHVIAYDDTDFDIGVSSPTTDDRVAEVAQDQVRELVGDTLDDYEPVGLFGDDVSDELLEYLDEIDVRYLVIGGRRRSPVGKLLFGSTAQSILLNAEHSVVTVL